MYYEEVLPTAPHIDIVNGVGDARVEEREKENTFKGEMKVVRARFRVPVMVRFL